MSHPLMQRCLNSHNSTVIHIQPLCTIVHVSPFFYTRLFVSHLIVVCLLLLYRNVACGVCDACRVVVMTSQTSSAGLHEYDTSSKSQFRALHYAARHQTSQPCPRLQMLLLGEQELSTNNYRRNIELKSDDEVYEKNNRTKKMYVSFLSEYYQARLKLFHSRDDAFKPELLNKADKEIPNIFCHSCYKVFPKASRNHFNFDQMIDFREKQPEAFSTTSSKQYCKYLDPYLIFVDHIISFITPMKSSRSRTGNKLLSRSSNYYRAIAFLLLICFNFLHTKASFTPEQKYNFSKSQYNVSIYENCLPRTYVRGSDLMGINLSSLPHLTQVRYSIVGGDPEGFFTAEHERIGDIAVMRIRTKTGLKDVLNRERRSKYVLQIQANVKSTQKKLESITASTVVHIVIEDTNDNIPLFFPDKYTVEISEDIQLNSGFVHVTAQDADSGMNGEVYYFLADPSSNIFSVQPTTGKVAATKSLHLYHSKKMSLKIFARDRGSRPGHLKKSAITEATVDISVIRVNKFAPKISINNLPQLLEHAHVHIYAIITVTDSDEDYNGAIQSVEIVDGDPEKVFAIAKGTNDYEFNLIVMSYADRELAPSGYNLTIRATDRGSPQRSSEVSLLIVIADLNDQTPIFLRESYEEDISEEAPPDTPVVRIASADLDQGTNSFVTFRILAGNQYQKFKINARTGLISTAGWLDAETKTYYSLTVAVIDQSSTTIRKQSSAKVTIRILDANDNAPEFNTPNTEVTVDENEPAGSYVTRVSATDADSSENGFISYSIANINPVPFLIDPFDGVIKTSKVLDYESEIRTYTLKVRASDWGQPFKMETETTVKVNIRDINDNTPRFYDTNCTGWLTTSTPIGTHIMTFKANDLDANSVITYNIINKGRNSCLTVDNTSGVLSLSCDLKVNKIASSKTIFFNVTASDGRFLSDVQTIQLQIVNGQEIPIDRKLKSHQVKCISFNTASVSTVSGEPKEVQQTETETYALLPLRYGYNAHPPQFLSNAPISVDVYENAPVGLELFKCLAIDKDNGHNGRIVYSISSGDLDSVFEIDVHTGAVSIVSHLDRERTSSYELNITIYDLGLNHLSASKNVTVNILDVNDNAPEFTKVSYSLHLPENTKNGTSVAQLLAIDPDEGDNAEVTYEIITKTQDFILDSVSGSLYVARTLDRERMGEFELRVRAWDSGKSEQRYSVATVFITVLDMNDCAPDFGAGKYVSVTIPEDYPIGTVVATMRATDPDLGDGGKITYSLVSNPTKMFRIDIDTGIVRIASDLDYEKDQMHNLTVRATDSGFPALHSDANLFVLIEDVPESNSFPHFLHRVVESRVEENQPSGSQVLTLQVSSSDSDQLRFAITDGSGIGLFTVTSQGE